MEINMIIKKIEQRRKKLEKTIYNEVDISFLKKYLKDNRIAKIDDFMNIDISTFVKSIYYVKKNGEISYDEISDCFDSFIKVFLNTDYSPFCLFMNFLLVNCDEEINRGIYEYLYNDSFLVDNVLKLSSFLFDNEKIEYIKELKEVQKNYNLKLYNLFNLYSKDKDLFIDLLCLFKTKRGMEQDFSEIKEEIKSLPYRVRNIDIKRNIHREFINKYDINIIRKYNNLILTFIKSEEEKRKKYNEEVTKEIRNLDVLKKMIIELNGQKEIKNAKVLISYTNDELLQLVILKFIYEHNRIYHRKIEKKLEEIETKTENKYIMLLKDYNINIDINNISSIMKLSLNDIRYILDRIRKLDLSNDEMIKILENTTIIDIDEVLSLLDKGYICKSIIKNNSDILYNNSIKRKLLLNNINIIDKYMINPFKISNSFGVLLGDSELLESNLDICCKYNLISCFKDIDNYNFLVRDDLVNIIDRCIELDLYKYLVNNIELLNNNNWDRVELLNSMKIEIDSSDMLISVLYSDNFFISDDLIPDYLPSIRKHIIDMNIDDIDLDDYMINNYVYNIGGVLISKLKVERLLSLGYSKWDAIIYGLNINLDEYENIRRRVLYKK